MRAGPSDRPFGRTPVLQNVDLNKVKEERFIMQWRGGGVINESVQIRLPFFMPAVQFVVSVRAVYMGRIGGFVYDTRPKLT